MKENIKDLKKAVKEDVKGFPDSEIPSLLKHLNDLLIKYDDDSLTKDLKDEFKISAKMKQREKCEVVLVDLAEELLKEKSFKQEELMKELIKLDHIFNNRLANTLNAVVK